MHLYEENPVRMMGFSFSYAQAETYSSPSNKPSILTFSNTRQYGPNLTRFPTQFYEFRRISLISYSNLVLTFILIFFIIISLSIICT